MAPVVSSASAEAVSQPFTMSSICLSAPSGEDQVPSVWSCELSCGTVGAALILLRLSLQVTERHSQGSNT